MHIVYYAFKKIRVRNLTVIHFTSSYHIVTNLNWLGRPSIGAQQRLTNAVKMKQAVRVATQCPRPSPPPSRAAAAVQTQRSSTFPRRIRLSR